MKKETKPVQFYVDQELEGRFREICMKMCINRSQFFRQRMQEFVDANGAEAGRGADEASKITRSKGGCHSV